MLLTIKQFNFFLQKNSVLDRKNRTELFRFGSGSVQTTISVRFGSVRKNFLIRFSVLSVRFGSGPNRPNAQP